MEKKHLIPVFNLALVGLDKCSENAWAATSTHLHCHLQPYDADLKR